MLTVTASVGDLVPMVGRLPRNFVAYFVAVTVAEIILLNGMFRLAMLTEAAIFVIILASIVSSMNSPGEGASQYGRLAEWPSLRLQVVLLLPPLIRIVTIALPLEAERPLFQQLAPIPLILIAATLCVRALNLTRTELGLRHSWSRLTMFFEVVVVGMGIGLGYGAFRILHPTPMLDDPTVPQILALLLAYSAAGFVEEFVFRGVIRVALQQKLGNVGSLIWGIGLFALLNFGYQSIGMVLLSIAAAFIFEMSVRKSGSLLAPSLARGLAGFCLYLVFPLLHAGWTP